MPRHDPQLRLRHMLEYAREAIGLMRDKTAVWSTLIDAATVPGVSVTRFPTIRTCGGS
jgi:hypothetical protein